MLDGVSEQELEMEAIKVHTSLKRSSKLSDWKLRKRSEERREFVNQLSGVLDLNFRAKRLG